MDPSPVDLTQLQRLARQIAEAVEAGEAGKAVQAIALLDPVSAGYVALRAGARLPLLQREWLELRLALDLPDDPAGTDGLAVH